MIAATLCDLAHKWQLVNVITQPRLNLLSDVTVLILPYLIHVLTYLSYCTGTLSGAERRRICQVSEQHSTFYLMNNLILVIRFALAHSVILLLFGLLFIPAIPRPSAGAGAIGTGRGLGLGIGLALGLGIGLGAGATGAGSGLTGATSSTM